MAKINSSEQHPTLFDIPTDPIKKRCSRCKQLKELSEFYPRKVQKPKHDKAKPRIYRRTAMGRRADCIECCTVQDRIYLSRDDIRRKKREDRLAREYGITIAEYESILASQNGVCAICRKGQEDEGCRWNGKREHFSVDHCHTTGKVRGILCARCNLGIGMFMEDAEAMKKAVGYLEDFNEKMP